MATKKNITKTKFKISMNPLAHAKDKEPVFNVQSIRVNESHNFLHPLSVEEILSLEDCIESFLKSRQL